MAKPKRERAGGEIDNYIGARIRECRTLLGLTQQQLAEMIGVTHQQAYKYEQGINRMTAGQLYEFARRLDVPITYFYDGVDNMKSRQVAPRQRMMRQIARNFIEIPNEKHQAALNQIVRLLAGR